MACTGLTQAVPADELSIRLGVLDSTTFTIEDEPYRPNLLPGQWPLGADCIVGIPGCAALQGRINQE